MYTPPDVEPHHGEIVPATAAEFSLASPPAAEENPAFVYIASLRQATSRRTMGSALAQVALLLTGTKNIGAVAWHRLTYVRVMAIRAYFGERLKARSLNKLLSGVKGVVKQAANMGLMSRETAAGIRDVEGVDVDDALAGRALDHEEVNALFDACHGGDAMAMRDRALLTLLFGAGLRRREIATIPLAKFDTRKGRVTVLGKGAKTRTVQLHEDDAEAVRAWCRLRGNDAGPLLVSFTPQREIKREDDGSLHPLTETGIYEVLRVIAGRASVTNITPHDARRTRITFMLDEGTGSNSVRRAVGHKSSTTTDRYDRTKDEAAHAATGKVRSR